VLRRATPKQATRGDRRFAFALGFLCCVLFPAFVTLIAPITALTLSWDGERVNASATRFVYIVIPYATTTLADATAVDTALTPAHTEREPAGSETVTVEGEGKLHLSGPTGSLTVPISPLNRESAHRAIQAFLAHPNHDGLHLWAVANWKFSVIAGSLLSLLTVLYVVGCVLALRTWVVQVMRSALARSQRRPRARRTQRR
jgi:hypothetical protein